MTTPFDTDFAFPFAVEEQGMYCTGMSLRDYFAAKAMQSAYFHLTSHADFVKHWTIEGVAQAAYSMADEMLKARSA